MYDGYYSGGGAFIFLLAAMALSFYAQFKVQNTFAKYSKMAASKGLTGAEVAKALLASEGIRDVRVEHVNGSLSDHYDPNAKAVRLSDSVFASSSIAAVGVAAHETGHALQHHLGYKALSFRSSLFPLTNFSSKAAMPLIIAGLFLSSLSGLLGYACMLAGVILFSFAVLFQIVTLPVEFNASSRALKMLEANGMVTDAELGRAKSVLSAAALTYVAAAAVAVANLLRFVLMLFSNRNRR